MIGHRFNHENDTEDIPEGEDPLDLAKHHKGQPFKTIGELLQERAQIRMDSTMEEIEDIQKQQASEDNLVQTDYERIPHENDTDDVTTDNVDYQYNHKHSKGWNEEVNKKAMEIENEIKIEENMKLAQKKAAEDAKIKAEQERVRKAEEKRKKLEQEQKERALAKDQINKRTVDLGELYHGIDDVEAVQLDRDYEHHSRFMQGLLEQTEKSVDREWDDDEASQKQQAEAAEDEKLGLYATREERKKIDLDKIEETNNVQLERPYEKHHQAWYEDVDRAADKLEQEMADVEAEQEEKEHTSAFKTVNHNELYENINLQTGNKYHTEDFNDRVEAYEKTIAAEIKQDDDVELNKKMQQEASRVIANGMTPVPISMQKVEVSHPNPSINLGEIYGTMNKEEEANFIQVNFEHEHDNDDIVPELTENIVIEQKKKEVDTRKTDFAGDKFVEMYDE